MERKPRTTGKALNFDGAHQFGREIMHESQAVRKLDHRLRLSCVLAAARSLVGVAVVKLSGACTDAVLQSRRHILPGCSSAW